MNKVFFSSFTLLLSTIFTFCFAQKTKTETYFPAYNQWISKNPTEFGLNIDKINETIKFAQENEIKNPRNMEVSHYQSFGKEPFGFAIGHFAERCEPTGLIIHKGYIVAQWGEPDRCDITHSVTKSFLSSVVDCFVTLFYLK